MEIKRIAVKIKDLAEGYTNETETDIEQGVYAYNGKLCVRPKFQRSFVYKKPQENAVINTALMGFPLNIMYWVDNGDGTYDCLDGQQRTISLCNFVDGITSYKGDAVNAGKEAYIHTVKRINPDLYETFMNYELEVYICKGTKSEQLDWFRTINIAGEKLYDQELRNASYVSEWLTDAKRHFSTANPDSTAKCPAERIGEQYTNKNANRQELLEQVISWKVESTDDVDICNYMEVHMNDTDASDLWNYFNDVIDWVKEIFPGDYDKGMKSVNWGVLYNHHKEDDLDPDEISTTFNTLIKYKATKELDISIAKICEYCITKDEKLLKHRAFNEAQKITLYNQQKGICPICGEHFMLNEMHAHHKVSWYNGGMTDISNGVMLCKECHTSLHANVGFEEK